MAILWATALPFWQRPMVEWPRTTRQTREKLSHQVQLAVALHLASMAPCVMVMCMQEITMTRTAAIEMTVTTATTFWRRYQGLEAWQD